jgi:hypothetical protein
MPHSKSTDFCLSQDTIFCALRFSSTQILSGCKRQVAKPLKPTKKRSREPKLTGLFLRQLQQPNADHAKGKP